MIKKITYVILFCCVLFICYVFFFSFDDRASYEKKIKDNLFEDLKGQYGDKESKSPLKIKIPAPSGKAGDYPGDGPSTAPPPGIPIWCPPPEEGYGPPPPYPEANECVY